MTDTAYWEINLSAVAVAPDFGQLTSDRRGHGDDRVVWNLQKKFGKVLQGLFWQGFITVWCDEDSTFILSWHSGLCGV